MGVSERERLRERMSEELSESERINREGEAVEEERGVRR